MLLSNPTHFIQAAKRLVESDRRSEIRLRANGGNSILIVCDPMMEMEYIKQFNGLLTEDQYSIIDLNICLTEFVTKHQSELPELFDQLQSATHEIFKAPAGEQSEDLFKNIIIQIQATFNNNKVPVLINCGALYGTGIEHIHIMENDAIMGAALPLIVLYPATREGDKLMFLGKRPSSKYRCMIVE